MRFSKKWLLIAVLAAFTCLFVACIPTSHVSFYDHSDQYEVGNFTYNADGIDKVYVHWHGGSITFVQSDAATLSVSESGTTLNDEQKLHWFIETEEKGKDEERTTKRTLRIEFCESEYDGVIPSTEKQLTVEIPAGIELAIKDTAADVTMGDHELKDLDIYSTSGDITTGSLTVAGADIGSITGTIEIESLIATENVDMITTTGAIRVGTLQANAVDVNSVSGHVDVAAVSASTEVVIKTTSGSIKSNRMACSKVNIITASGKVEMGFGYCSAVNIETTSGKVDLAFDSRLGARVRYETLSGKFTCESYKMDGDKYVVSNGSCELTVYTTSGNLTVSSVKKEK